MEVKVLGFKRSSFTPSGESREITGYNLACSRPDPTWEGAAIERIYVSDSKIGSYVPKVNDTVNVYYNKYGKVDSIQLAKLP